MIPNLFPSEDDSGTIFRDVITLALAGFMALVILMLPHINPVASKDQDNSTPPGSVIVEMYWPNESPSDVDLWVQAPGDVPVGYSNKGGLLFNLLRDDLGHVMDVDKNNYEVSYTRGLVPGEYVVNVHLYRLSGGSLPIPVEVAVGVKQNSDQGTKPVLTSTVNITREGQEKTVVRFILDEHGNLVKESLNRLYKQLRVPVGNNGVAP